MQKLKVKAEESERLAIHRTPKSSLIRTDTTGDAPLLTATFGPKKVPAKWGKFGTSNVWAAQGNTIPATFWTMAYVMASPDHWLRRCQEECRTVFAGLPDKPTHPAWRGSWADASNLEKMIPITAACFMEALRLKGTGAEFRVVCVVCAL